MAEISAATVKSLREQTGLPMMDCKRALQETDGNIEQAVDWLRKQGKKVAEKRSGRSTSLGRITIYADFDGPASAMIDLRCESAPVANNEQFMGLAADMAKQLATGPGADCPENLIAQPSPSNPSQTLGQQFDDLNNRIREAFKLERIIRIDGSCAGYAHHTGGSGVLLQVEGGNAELARDICMHIAAMRPLVLNKEDLDPALIEKERALIEEVIAKEADTIKTEAEQLLAGPDQMMQDPKNLEKSVSSHALARNELKKLEGMARNKAKVVEGRLNVFYGERCLMGQPHANQAKYAGKSIADLAKAAGMKIVRFVHWELPKE